jgi:MoxR-like ATPase
MMKDWLLGEPLLLIGNQGVGKNKLGKLVNACITHKHTVDKMLELLQIEREYIQLHRDTTVQMLTLFPSVQGGVIVWEDSPLVRNNGVTI